MTSILKINDLDLSKLKFSDVKVNAQGRKLVFVNNNDKKIILQTPKMYLPNGINRWRQKDVLDNKSDAFEMELSFGGDSPDVIGFHEKMKEYDEIVKQQILENPKDWVNKQKISLETIEDAFYNPVVRLAYDKNHNKIDYPDRIKIKIDREKDGDDYTGKFLSNKKFKTPVLGFDTNRNPIEFNESNYEQAVPKGSHVVCIIELVYISIAAKISTKWKLVQFKVFKNQQNINDYALIDDEENDGLIDDNNEIEEVEAVEEAVEAVEEAVGLDSLTIQEPVVDSVIKEKRKGSKKVAN